MADRHRARRAIARVAAVLLLTAAVAACDQASADASPGTPIAYRYDFAGEPDAPLPFVAAGWDVQVHKRDHHLRPGQLDAMEAEHGPGCEGPHLTHQVSTVAQAVFLCRDHVMTAIHAEDYGLVYLTPDHLVDFSAGEAVVRIDVSTLRGSTRDWWDLWITPWDDQLARPFDLGDVDLQGPPRNALHVRMLSENVLCIDEYRDGNAITPHHLESGCAWWAPYEQWLTPDAARRDTFEIRVSATQVSVGMPEYDRTFHTWTPPSPIPWRHGIVQLGHHSYTPTKDGAGAPHTWHWDELEIDPALPFQMIGAVGGPHTYVRSADGHPCDDACTVAFEHPAPAGAYLRFAAWGTVDLDVGDGWRRVEGNRPRTKQEHAMSYWVPIPTGTQSVRFRFGDAGWWDAGQGAMATGFGIWSREAAETGASGNAALTDATAVPTSRPRAP